MIHYLPKHEKKRNKRENEYMKIIYLNSGGTKINEYMNGHCSCEHYLSYSENKAWKKFQDCTGTLYTNPHYFHYC